MIDDGGGKAGLVGKKDTAVQMYAPAPLKLRPSSSPSKLSFFLHSSDGLTKVQTLSEDL